MDSNAYSTASRLFHRFVLGVPFLGEGFFELQTAFNKAGKKRSTQPHAPVFIAGLARAGTTLLLQTLYDTGLFRSLTYRDMPLVMMPSLWRVVSQPFALQQAASERAHQDGVQVGFDSPEGFEELFWRSFCAKDYIGANALHAHRPTPDITGKFRQFVRNVLLASQAGDELRYLAKNNNNLLRLDAIKDAFSDAIIIIPFRDPVQQAVSLHRQHALFTQRHAQDGFTLNYMNWLAHHEFGANHKPMQLGAERFTPAHTPDQLEYWLEYWIYVYGYVLAHAQGCVLFSYERFCHDPMGSLLQLCNQAGIDAARLPALEAIKPRPAASPDIDAALKSRADAIYAQLECS